MSDNCPKSNLSTMISSQATGACSVFTSIPTSSVNCQVTSNSLRDGFDSSVNTGTFQNTFQPVVSHSASSQISFTTSFDSYNNSNFVSNTFTSPVNCNSNRNTIGQLNLSERDTSNLSESPPLPSCLDLPVLDSGLSNSANLVQDSTSMSQMSLSDLDITGVDIPHLLSEGTGLIEGNHVTECVPPKLLDSSGDTSDLSDVFMKLQEATAGIPSSDNGGSNDLATAMFHEQLLTATAHLPTHTHNVTRNMALSRPQASAVTQPNLLSHPMEIGSQQTSKQQTSLITTFTDALASNLQSINNDISLTSNSEATNVNNVDHLLK